MKSPPSPCACGKESIRKCGKCGTPLCDTHGRLSVDGTGQKQYLCFACDERRHQHTAWRPRT
jgi:hypothetical protein